MIENTATGFFHWGYRGLDLSIVRITSIINLYNQWTIILYICDAVFYAVGVKVTLNRFFKSLEIKKKSYCRLYSFFCPLCKNVQIEHVGPIIFCGLWVFPRKHFLQNVSSEKVTKPPESVQMSLSVWCWDL